MNPLSLWLAALLGLDLEAKQLSFEQMCLRGIFVFAVALLMIRLSDRRSLTKKSPFDVVLLVILASVLARAINGSAPFFPTIGAAFVLVVVHRALAFLSFRWPAMAVVIKGRPHVLVRDGEFQSAPMELNHISSGDIEEDLRLTARREEVAQIKVARLEASGDISFIMR